MGVGEGGQGRPAGAFDPAAHLAVVDLVRGLVADGIVTGVHDVADGGLALSLAELAVRSGVGVEAGGVEDWMALFSESPSRFVVAAQGDAAIAVTRRADAAGVPWRHLGRAGGERIVVEGLVDVAVAEATEAWRDRLPAAFGTAAAH